MIQAREPQFGPIALELIAKGQLAKKLDERLAIAAEMLATYVQEGGVDLTKKAKTTVILKIDLLHVEAGVFTVKGDVSAKAPSVPLPSTDRLILDENGHLVMPLAPELNAKDDPRQMTFAHAGNDPERKKEL